MSSLIGSLRIITTVLLSLLVNVAVVAHNVIPHHHHNDVFTVIIGQFGEDVQQQFNHFHSQTSHKHLSHVGLIMPELKPSKNSRSSCVQHLTVEIIAVEPGRTDLRSILDATVSEWSDATPAYLLNVCVENQNLRAPPCLYM